jgi:hypothetical protein
MKKILALVIGVSFILTGWQYMFDYEGFTEREEQEKIRKEETEKRKDDNFVFDFGALDKSERSYGLTSRLCQEGTSVSQCCLGQDWILCFDAQHRPSGPESG